MTPMTIQELRNWAATYPPDYIVQIFDVDNHSMGDPKNFPEENIHPDEFPNKHSDEFVISARAPQPDDGAS
jgi:hypothetical protein